LRSFGSVRPYLRGAAAGKRAGKDHTAQIRMTVLPAAPQQTR
jgi:hypothetical protein